jgi:hypothetical protein
LDVSAFAVGIGNELGVAEIAFSGPDAVDAGLEAVLQPAAANVVLVASTRARKM